MPAKYKKRADGRYCTHVVIGVKPDGKPQRKTIYAKTIRELEEKAAELRRQVGTGTIVKDGGMTVSEWAQEWLRTYKMGSGSKTYSMYETMVRVHIVPTLGHIKLRDIRPFHVQRLINEMRNKGLTRATEQAALSLKQIFRRAVENNIMAKSPAELIELPKKVKPKKRAIKDSERIAFESAILDAKSRAFYCVLLYAGLRRSEALSLNWADIDFDANTVRVSKAWTNHGNKTWIKPMPKSDAGNRDIPMPEALFLALKAHRMTARDEIVFPSAAGELMTVTVYRRFWGKIADGLNTALGGAPDNWILPSDITPHIFRHSYATMLFYAGVDVKTAQYLLGHSTLAMTMDIYTHLDKGKVGGAADKIDSYISSSQDIVNEA